MKQNPGQPLRRFLLGFFCAAVVVLLVRLDTPRVAMAADDPTYIAITGQDSTGEDLLYLVNAPEHRAAVYQWDNNFYYFLAVRDLKSDFSPDIQDWTNSKHHKVTSKDIRDEIARLKEKTKPK